MSTLVAAGPVVPLDGPIPRPPRHRLLSVPGVLVPADAALWRAGANVNGYPADKPSLWAQCEAGTIDLKVEGEGRPQTRFFTFSYYLPIKCGTIGNIDFDAFLGVAEAVLEATESYAIERALVHGVLESSNPFLGDAGLEILGGGAVSPGIALSHLDDAIADSARAGLIHLPRSIVNRLGDQVRIEGGDLFTLAGTPIAVGDGYVDADPANGAATAGAGTTDWAFATGPVEVRLSEPYPVGEDWAESLDRETNEAVVRVERDALVIWDGVVQAGVLVDWAT